MKAFYIRVLILIILIAAFFRFYMLGEVPVGISKDEASLGYNAYSILQTDKDEHGVFLPLAFKSFGEYKAPLYIYLTTPFIYLFNLTVFTTRFTSAFLGLLTVLCVFLLAEKLFSNKKLALISSFIMAVIPWHLQFTRIAYEGSVTLFLLTIATIFFIIGLKDKKLLIFSSIFFSLTIYSHYSVRVFTPLFIIALGIIYRSKIANFKKQFITFLLLGFIIFLPIGPFLFSEAGLSRASYISFTTDKGITFAINEKRAEHLWSSNKIIVPAEILHNKIIDFSKRFLDNYLSHFDFSFLFQKGDEDILFKTPYFGLLYYSFIPILLIGFYKLIKIEKTSRNLIFAWLILAPVASSLTRLSASGNRAFIMVVPISLILGLGLFAFLSWLRSNAKVVRLIIYGLFMVEIFLYFDSYFIHMQIKNSTDKRIGSKNLIEKISMLEKNYDQILVTDKLGGYIHFLFYLKYPPIEFQKQAEMSPLNEFGFGEVLGFSKYKFGRIPKYYDFSKNILFVVNSSEEPNGLIPMGKTFFPDGRDAFLIYDTETVSRYCSKCSLNEMPINLNIYGEETLVR